MRLPFAAKPLPTRLDRRDVSNYASWSARSERRASNVVGNDLPAASIGGLEPYARFLSSHAFELFLREYSNGCDYIRQSAPKRPDANHYER
jgi:hypothetical protein